MIKKILLAALLLASGTAHAQLYSKFGPVTGVLKGNVSTPQTSNAVSADIIGLWTGCTGSNFLRGDGACASVTTAAAGSTGNVQYNNAGAFAATGDFTWDATNLILSLGNASVGGPTIVTPATTTSFGNQIFIQGGTATANGTGGGVVIDGGGAVNNTGGNSTVEGGSGTGTHPGGGAIIQGGHASNASGGGAVITTFSGNTSGNASGTVAISTGNTSGAGNVGVVSIIAGGSSGSGSGGNVSISSGFTSSGTAGNITLTTGTASGGGTSGSIAITAAHNAGGTDGGITLAAHNATVITIGAGTQIGAPTGGDKGVGTLNATGLFVNGVAVSAGSTSPGGADTQVQYNNAGAFAGSADFAWINGSRTLNIGSAGAGVVTPVVNASGTGRALTIRGGGTSNTSSSPGDLNISGGTNSVDGPGGNIFVNAGSGTGASGAAGGSVFVNGGSGVVGFSGGAVTITAGSGGSAAGNGADATLNGGNGGTTGGVGGNANIGGGTPTQGNGGSVLITGAAGVGTNRNGGSITLTSGAATGSGTVGKINLVSSSVVVNGGFLSLTGSTNGLSFTDTSAASTNQSWSIGNFSTQWHLRPCNDAVSSCGADSITVSRSANSTTTIALTGTSATSLTFNSGIIPSSGRIIWAVVTGAAGSCSVTSSSGLANTTCTRSGVGAYTLNPPSGFANNSPCTASAIRANGANITAEADGSSSTIGISTYTGSTGAAFEATSGVSVVCVSST